MASRTRHSIKVFAQARGEQTRSVAPFADTRMVGMKLCDYEASCHGHRSRQFVRYSGLHTSMMPTAEEMKTTSSSPELQQRMMVMSLRARLFSAHSISSFVRHVPTPTTHFDIPEEASSNSAQNKGGDEQKTSTPMSPPLLARCSTLPSILPSSIHATFDDLKAFARTASAPDVNKAPARRHRCFAPVRTCRPPALVELERPGSKQTLVKEGHAGVEMARGHSLQLLAPLRPSSFMEHTYTSKRDLELMLALKKERLARRGGSSGVREVGSVRLVV